MNRVRGEEDFMKSVLKQYIQESCEFEYLTQEREKELGKRILEGDQKAREEMINSHLRLVICIAKRFCKSNPMILEDLIQEGNLGLITAADHFNSEKNIRFSVYAKMWIIEFIKRKFYKDLYIVKTPFRVARKSLKIQNQEEFLGPEKIKGENHAIENMMKKPVYLCYSLFTNENAANKEVDYFEILADTRETAQEKVEQGEMIAYLIKKVEASLNKKEAEIIRQRYLEPDYKITYKKISDNLNISTETVRNLERKAIVKLRKNLKKELSIA